MFDGVCQAAALLPRHGVTFNTLSVVNPVTAKHPAEVYRFLTEEPRPAPPSVATLRGAWRYFRRPARPAVRGGDAWHGKRGPKARKLGLGGDRLVGRTRMIGAISSAAPSTFWRNGDEDQVAVNWFESLLSLWMGVRPDICTMVDVCGRAVVVERDGAVYPCDHFVYPEYRLGALPGKGGDAHGHSPIFAEAKLGRSPSSPTWFTRPSNEGLAAASVTACP